LNYSRQKPQTQNFVRISILYYANAKFRFIAINDIFVCARIYLSQYVRNKND